MAKQEPWLKGILEALESFKDSELYRVPKSPLNGFYGQDVVQMDPEALKRVFWVPA